jgi:hypothetical protein
MVEDKPTCDRLRGLVEKRGFEVTKVVEDGEKCIIDFRHPKVRVEKPVSYFLSSAVLNKKDGSITATVRSKVDAFKRLELDYCCEKEDGECVQVCKPHVWMEEKILSVEAHFKEDAMSKLGTLLSEMI